MFFLVEDPFPKYKLDSHRWVRLFRLIPIHVLDKQIAELLSKRMWTLRSIGATMQRDLSGIRIVPILAPEGGWSTIEEYEELTVKYLKPYSNEIKRLILMVEDQTD